MHVHADQFNSIVVDESHNVKDKSTKRYKAILNLALGKDFRLLLSGTPILNRTSELIPQLTILGYLNEETSTVFKREYCQKTTNIHALQRMNTKLRNMCMVKRNKADVDIELPEVTRTIIEADINNRKEYNLILQDLAKYLENMKRMTPAEITKSMRAEALIRTSHLKRVAAEGYRDQVIEFCKSAIDSNQSLLLFCSTKTAMDYYQKALGTTYRIDGTVLKQVRQYMITKYQDSNKPEIFIIGIRSGGVGINLTKADYVVHAEKDWVPLYHDQATSRTHRIGRTEHINEYFFVGRDTIDKRIMDIMEEKRLIAEVGTGANDIATQVTTSVYKDVMKREFDYDTTNDIVSGEVLAELL
jgi:SWI/SNF-related matrix-associated actin-dependent regulator 1 of chromatin subfamily A